MNYLIQWKYELNCLFFVYIYFIFDIKKQVDGRGGEKYENDENQ